MTFRAEALQKKCDSERGVIPNEFNYGFLVNNSALFLWPSGAQRMYLLYLPVPMIPSGSASGTVLLIYPQLLGSELTKPP